MNDEFRNKVVLVTGVTGNVGAATARRFAADGARLALVGQRADAVTRIADSLAAETAVEVADLADEGQVDALIRRVETRFERIDVAVHTVGGFIAGRAVHEPGLDQLERAWRLNVLPTYLVCGRVARHMLEHDIAGHILAVGARSGLRGAAKTSAYSAAKAAAMRIVESLALEVRDRGIHVNAILPSTLDTPQNRADMPKADPARWVTPEQFADAIAFLCSSAAAGMYGANLEVYGRT